jgi:hypothetical protein
VAVHSVPRIAEASTTSAFSVGTEWTTSGKLTARARSALTESRGIRKAAGVGFNLLAGVGGQQGWREPILWIRGSGWLRRRLRARPAAWRPRRSWSASRAAVKRSQRQRARAVRRG